MIHSYITAKFGFLVAITLASLNSSCNQDPAGSARGTGATGATISPSDQILSKITIASPSSNTLFTKGATSNTCVTLSLSASSAVGTGLPNVTVTFELKSETDVGTLSPETVTTGETGVVSTEYCSGKDPGKVSIVAKSGAISSTPLELTIVDQPAAALKSLSISNPAEMSFYTKSATEKTCGNFSLLAKDDRDQPLEGIKPTFSLKAAWVKDPGQVTPLSEATDSEGKLYFNYCTGESEGTVVILAKVASISTNSGEITVANKPVYALSYLRSNIDADIPGAANNEDDTLSLNLKDSGPTDCLVLTFKLTNVGTPWVGKTVEFVSQPDYPKGAKLAEKSVNSPLTKPFPYPAPTSPSTGGRVVAYYSTTSKTNGEVDVPVCAGNMLGTLLITGLYTAPDGKVHTAKSPIIRINSGVANYRNLSLTFDPINGRNLRAYFNTNSSFSLKLKMQLGSRQDGSVVTDNPVFVASEAGRIEITDPYPDPVSNTVDFKLQALHLVDNYPYQILRMQTHPLAQTRCDAKSLANWAKTQNSNSHLSFRALSRNWRVTMAYGVRGQESYHDANGDGIYTAGGDGFWDKNQDGFFDDSSDLNYNGVYDAFTNHVDGYTYPTNAAVPSIILAGSNYKNETTHDLATYTSSAGAFNRFGEWFIDLPSPFVDVDEDGICNTKIDFLPFGDSCQNPNSQRDADTIIWKYETLPVSMGASAFSLLNWRILPSTTDTGSYIYDLDPLPYGNFGYDLPIHGSELISFATLQAYGGGAVIPEVGGFYRSLIFLHDICGNLLPGGTEITVSLDEVIPPAYGDRGPFVNIYTQPGDDALESSRRLVFSTDASTTVKVNSNVIDHPSAQSSYPLVMRFDLPACDNFCTGDVKIEGVACGGYSAKFRAKVQEPKMDELGSAAIFLDAPISIASVKTCTCATGAIFNNGSCTCPAGLVNIGGTCTTPPTEEPAP